MPYTSEEIKKQLDDAVKIIQASVETAMMENAKPDDASVRQEPAPTHQSEPDREPARVPPRPAAQQSEPDRNPEPDREPARVPPRTSAHQSVPDQKPVPERKPARVPPRTAAQQSVPGRKPVPDRKPAPDRKPELERKPARVPPRSAAQKAKPANTERPGRLPEKEKIRSFDISPEGDLTEQPAKSQAANPSLDTGPAGFKINFDFDDAYKNVPEDRPLRLRREKRTGCVGGILYSVFVICISLVLASMAWLAASDVLGFGTTDEQVYVMVESGFDIEDIIEKLYDAGLIKYKFLFKMYADYSNAEEKIAAGSYALNKNYDYRAIVHGMTARGGILEETTVTIPEGLTLAETFMRLEDHGVCAAADLWETAANYDFNYSFLDKSTLGDRHRLEGFLFPDTHNFYVNSSPILVIDKFLNEFNSRFTETYIERAEFMGYSIHEIVTIASMIEREAGSDEERSRIAAVIYNRLNNSATYPFLQIDATIYYVMARMERSFSLDLDSPYNTYINAGLPPGPIANPGHASIYAALYPDSTDEFFYALNLSGTHEFFRTLAQHEAFVASDEFGGR